MELKDMSIEQLKLADWEMNEQLNGLAQQRQAVRAMLLQKLQKAQAKPVNVESHNQTGGVTAGQVG